MVQILRHFGLAARFVSGYLIQLTPDVKSLDGPSGTEVDFTDLHAWTEFFAGCGLGGTRSNLGSLHRRRHLPLAATPAPQTAAQSRFAGAMRNEVRFQDDGNAGPRRPAGYEALYDAQWEAVDRAGQHVDEILKRDDVRLTMGGEPTFVFDRQRRQPRVEYRSGWPDQSRVLGELDPSTPQRYAPKGFLHYGQGKWYPGESLPRWPLRVSGEPTASRCGKTPSGWPWRAIPWCNVETFGGRHGTRRGVLGGAGTNVGSRIEVDSPAYEDPWHAMHVERRLPVDVDPLNSKLEDHEERRRLARLVEQGLTRPVGYVLPSLALGGKPGELDEWSWPMRAPRLMLIRRLAYRLAIAARFAPAPELGVSPRRGRAT